MSGSAALSAALKRRGGIDYNTMSNNKSVTFENLQSLNSDDNGMITMSRDEFLQQLDDRISRIENFLPLLSKTCQQNTAKLNSISNEMSNFQSITTMINKRIGSVENKIMNINNIINKLDISQESMDNNPKNKNKIQGQNKIKLNVDESN